MTDKYDLFDKLASHSNIVDICREFNIGRKDLLPLLGENLIRLTDVKVPINGKSVMDKTINGAKPEMVNIIVCAIKKDFKANILIAVVQSVEAIADDIASQIIRQLDNLYKKQGTWNWLFQRKSS